MLELKIPGRKPLQLTTLICDINGTLAADGQLLAGVMPLLTEIGQGLDVYLLSADTMGSAAEIAEKLGVKLYRLQPGNEIQQKADFLNQFGSEHCIAIGQGANDEAMLRDASLGICVLSQEGTAAKTLLAADIVTPDIVTALQLIQHPKRITATLRQ